MNSWVIEMPESTSVSELLSQIELLKKDSAVHGILVQLPLPLRHLDEAEVIAAIPPEKDVDAFHIANVGRIMIGNYDFLPCTPAGVMKLLEAEAVSTPAGKECVVVGSIEYSRKAAGYAAPSCQRQRLPICHSKTVNLAEVTRRADILVVAVGKADFITGDMVKAGRGRDRCRHEPAQPTASSPATSISPSAESAKASCDNARPRRGGADDHNHAA